MERIPKGVYTLEFRGQAVQLHKVDRLTMPEVAKRLSLPAGALKNWVYASRQGKLGEEGKNQKPLTELEMELARVKREPVEVRIERDLPKKSGGLLCEGVAVKYGRMEELRQQQNGMEVLPE